MHKKKEITLLVISHGENNPLNIKLPIFLLKLGTALFLVFITFLFVFVHSYGDMAAGTTEKTAEVNQLKETNSRQKEKIKELKIQTQELAYQMTQIERLTTEVKEILEIETVEAKNTVKLEEQALERQEVDSELRLLVSRGGGYRDDFDIVNSEIRVNLKEHFQEKAQEFQSLRELAEDRREFLAHTPSIWPVIGRLTSPFGYRRSPFTRRWEFHGGVDIAAPRGTKVLATANGVVVKTSRLFGWGRLVVIDHVYERQTFYAHLNAFAVSEGDKVIKGQVIGYVGNSGRSTGSHLHYEVHVDGQRVNPWEYME